MTNAVECILDRSGGHRRGVIDALVKDALPPADDFGETGLRGVPA